PPRAAGNPVVRAGRPVLPVRRRRLVLRRRPVLPRRRPVLPRRPRLAARPGWPRPGRLGPGSLIGHNEKRDGAVLPFEPPRLSFPRPRPINPRHTAWVRAAPPSGGVVRFSGPGLPGLDFGTSFFSFPGSIHS